MGAYLILKNHVLQYILNLIYFNQFQLKVMISRY